MQKSSEKKQNTHGKSAFLKGAAWIAVGGFVAKLLGALYRIPLTNLIGGRGLGLYQLIYPIYCLLLTVSATGIPSSIAKLTAERLQKGKGDKPLLITALKLFLGIGVFGSLLMAALAPLLAKAQGTEEVLGGYFTLAPSVLLVSAISVFRGWFQGKNRMFPTALSEMVEQAVKVGFGLLFAYLFRESVQTAVVFLLLAVSLSELVALIVMIIQFRRIPAPDKPLEDGERVRAKSVLKLSIPVTLASIVLPISGLIDSMLFVRILESQTAEAVTLYGLFAGGAVTVINLPVSVCYGIAAASVPAVSAAQAKAQEGKRKSEGAVNESAPNDMRENEPNEQKGKRKKRGGVLSKIFFSFGVTLAVSVPSALGLYLLAEPAAKIIFRSLQGEELSTLVALIKSFSISAVTLSLTQTSSACLTAQGKPFCSALATSIGVTVKTLVYVLLLKTTTLGVFALAHATNLCYLVAFFVGLLYNIRIAVKADKGAKAYDNDSGAGR